MPVTKVDIDPDALAREIGRLSANDIDGLPFGAILLDRDGKVLAYNRAEEQLSGRSRTEVVGRNFFTEVAPCTRVKRFFGTFQEGIERKSLNEIFDFTFKFPGNPKEVRIRMVYAEAAKGVWIFVTPLTPL